MRCFIVATLLVGVLFCPKEAEALDCAWPGGWQYEAAEGVDAPAEQQRHDADARATLEWLERTPIIFRGRFTSARYLSDLRKTNVPTSLLIFDDVEILKGSLPRTSTDRKAFIIKEEWCDHSCMGKVTLWWHPGDTVVVGARPNNFIDPSRAIDFASKRVVYKGRIDGVLGMCDRGGGLSLLALQLLNAPDEVARLKREYLPRRPQ